MEREKGGREWRERGGVSEIMTRSDGEIGLEENTEGKRSKKKRGRSKEARREEKKMEKGENEGERAEKN